MQETKKTQPRKRKGSSRGRLDRFIWILAVAFLLTVCAAAYLVHSTVRQAVAAGMSFGRGGFQPVVTPGTPGVEPATEPTPTLVPLDPTPNPWDGSSRVTILLMGLDYRDWERGAGAPRSDTMMVVTIDPLTRTAGMVSVPRDLWIEIPGFDHGRINTAYSLGERYRLPGGGPGLAVKAVESVLGVPINYYAVVEFSAFERLIDEIGGIDVLVKQRIKISPIGRTSFWLDAKAHHLDGAEALAYARVRKNAGGDFGRAERQQQVAFAVLDKVTGFDMVPTLVRKAPRLYQEISSGIRTNMTLQEMVSLGWLALQIPKDEIRQGVIAPPDMVGFYTTETGAQVLRPVPEAIRGMRDRIFVETGAVGAPPEEILPETGGYEP